MSEQLRAQQALEMDSSEMDGKYLTFYTEKQLFGISIRDVVQIVGLQDITEVPDYPHYAKGIINMRGVIIPLIDVRLRLNKPEAPYTDRTCIIVTSIRDHQFGFIVDEVDEVTDIEDDLISPPPMVSEDGANRYLIGVARHNSKIVLLIDTARLLREDEFEALTQAAI